MSEDCVFCKIASGGIPSTVALDRDDVLAFHDINPQAPTHLLVIPKRHVRNATALGPSEGALLGSMIDAANELARAHGIAETGYRLVMNVGPGAGESVFHLHLHVLGGRPLAWPPG